MDTQTLAAVVSAGVGIVGFSVAAVFGAEAISRKSDAQSVCPGSTYCRTQQGVDRWNDASRAANVATVGFVIGCVGLAEAAVLWLTPGPISKAGAQLGLGPTGLRMRGTF